MLEEAVEVMRELWTGETVDHRGAYYEVDNARLFDPPTAELPLDRLRASAPEAAELAGRIGDGFWGNAPDPSSLERLRGGRRQRARATRSSTCAGPTSRTEARKTVHETWPNAAVPGSSRRTCPRGRTSNRRRRSSPRTHDHEVVPCGPDIADELVESVRSTSTPATTTSTSTRSATTRTASSASGSPTCVTR